MSWRCEHGFHTYRHVELTRHREIGVQFERPTWTHLRECKRCGFKRAFLIFRYPRIKIAKEPTP
jgi:hypothetical protein